MFYIYSTLLFELIYEYCNKDEKETIILINEILNELKNNKKFFFKLEKECVDFSFERNRCYYCGEYLEYKINKQEELEYFGESCKEDFTEAYCMNGCAIY